MMIQLHKGDYLTFASIANAVGVEVDGVDFRFCEKEPGVWRRHPDIGERSRSDISRDGYLGVILMAVVHGRDWYINDMRKAGRRRNWTMGDRGNFDYINIWPLVPILYSHKYKWIPTIPTLCTKFNNKGFRAHLLALTILIEHCMGKRRWSHRQGAKGLRERNPDNLWFRALANLVTGGPRNYYSPGVFDEDEYHWGGCPLELFIALTNFTGDLPR